MGEVDRARMLDQSVRAIAERISLLGYRRVLQTWIWCGLPKTFVTMIDKEFQRRWHLHLESQRP